MNIFFLHRCPRRAARYAVDKHVVKMLLETCQLLYTCHHATGSTALHEAPFRTGTVERGYKKLNPNHPCGKWLRASSVHYLWLSTYGMALLAEYDHRYGSTKTTKTKTTTPIKRHACAEHILWLHHNPPPFLQNYGWATPALAMPDIYKSGDPVASYRRYYLGDKQHILKWTGRHVPHWISPKVDSPQYIK
jgi:hypothetical protein